MIMRVERLTPSEDTRSRQTGEPRFEVLLGSHLRGEPERLGLVAAALAAINGVRWDGSPMDTEWARPATARDIANELGWRTVDAVTKSLHELAEAGVCDRYEDGWEIDAGVHGRRCSSSPLGAFKLDKASRRLNLPAPLLLFTGFVLHRRSAKSKHAVLGSTRLGEMTGWLRRTVNKRAAKLVETGVLKRWNRPGDRLACYCPGPAMSDAHSERAHVAESGSVTRRYTALHGERAPTEQREGPTDTVRGPDRHSERAHARGSTKGDQRTTKGRTSGAEDHGGGSLSENRSPEAEKVEEMLVSAGFTKSSCPEVADRICEKRGVNASTWTAAQLDELRADPNIRNVCGAFRSRIDRNLHDPVNDRPPRPGDHDAGAAIRAENTRAAEDRRAGDADYQKRRVTAMHRGDRKTPQFIADELGLPLAEVLRMLSQTAPQAQRTERARPAPRRLQAI